MSHRIHHLGRAPLRLDTGGPNGSSRTLRYAAYASSVPTPPDSCNWAATAGLWRPLGNLNIGDCTSTMVAHKIQSDTAADLGKAFLAPYRKVIQFYSATSGYRPGRPRTDRGADMLTVMNRWRKKGMAGHKIDAFASIDPTQTVQIRQATWLLGGSLIGLRMPLSLRAIVQAGSMLWDVQPGDLTGNNAPGSWGGHAIPILGYQSDGNGSWLYYGPSWDGLYTITEAFMLAYCDEAYAAMATQDWSRAGTAPNGLATATLLADVAAISNAA